MVREALDDCWQGRNAFSFLLRACPKMSMEQILSIYALYATGDHDLAISLTARVLAMDETVIRMAVES